MSVIKSERTEGRLEVITKAFGLCEYTIMICKNEKNFPKRDRWILTNDIVQEIKDAFKCIRSANSIYPKIREEYIRRHMLQVEANEHLETFLSLLEIAYKQLNLPSDRVEYWTGLAVETEGLLHKWIKADNERYKNVT